MSKDKGGSSKTDAMRKAREEAWAQREEAERRAAKVKPPKRERNAEPEE